MSRLEPRVLVADDQPDVLEAVRLLLKPEGFQLETADSPAAVLAAAESRELDVVLIDLNYTRDTTSGREGMDLLARLLALDPTLPVVVMTAWGSVDLAVEAMRRGARDFVQKPWDNARLVAMLRTQAELARALRHGQRLEAENSALRGESRPLLIAGSEAMRPVLELVERVGPSDANVLITGENGSGKGTIAAALHAVSARAARPLVTVNAGGLSEGVFESELFGHVKGAFTDAKVDRAGRFELADGGTLFLDEIANVPVGLQPKLLRVLETGEFERVGSSRTRRADVRVVSATNADLPADVAAGRFRQDLLFRLNTIEIHVPPLRERREDVKRLARHFLELHGRRYRRTLAGFAPEAERALRLARLAGQRARARPRRRACRADGARRADRGRRSRSAALGRAVRPARGHEPRGRRAGADREGAGPPRRQRQPRGGGARPLAQRPLQAAPAPRAMKRPRGRLLTHDRRVLLLALASGALPLAVALVLLRESPQLEGPTKWSLALLAAGSWLVLALAARESVSRPLQTLSNLLGALREGDFSFRARVDRDQGPLGDALRELNALAQTLREERLGALEATALLQRVMAEIEVAVFAFDGAARLRLANRAGEALLGQPAERLIDLDAETIGFAEILAGESPRVVEASFPGGAGRYELRLGTFRQGGKPHRLVVLSDVSRALREEERAAWQRLIRVMGHELNNSLAPIKSIAGSLDALVSREPRPADADEDLRRGLSVIGSRADSLGRFMEGYARLARLPAPRRRDVEVEPLLRRVAGMETRVAVAIEPGPAVGVRVDIDQVEQVLINLLRNAADAALETKGGVSVSWSAAPRTGFVEIRVDDDGPGLTSTANLFVPFFTTKPNGSGIGLVLSRQIAEAHGGSLTLANHPDGRGCRAALRLPRRSRTAEVQSGHREPAAG